jgi:5,10-methylenetetrahydromethanopterin reductase
VEIGIQLHLPTYRDLSVNGLVDLARTSCDAGLDQIWVTDNMVSRSNFVVLAALALNTTGRLGTAILGQYFRSPVEAASALLSISELMNGRELTVGIGFGNQGTRRHIAMPRPAAFMKELLPCLQRLLDGDLVEMDEYPLLASYFHFATGASFKVPIQACGPVDIYQGGNGPLGLALAGEHARGLIIGWQFLPAAMVGRLPHMLTTAEDAARNSGRAAQLEKVAEVKLWMGHDHQAVREDLRRSGKVEYWLRGLQSRGYSEAEFACLGISPSVLAALDTQPAHAAADLPDRAADAFYVVGDPAYCLERLRAVAASARQHGIRQLMLSELGPDPADAMGMLVSDVLPSL